MLFDFFLRVAFYDGHFCCEELEFFIKKSHLKIPLLTKFWQSIYEITSEIQKVPFFENFDFLSLFIDKPKFWPVLRIRGK